MKEVFKLLIAVLMAFVALESFFIHDSNKSNSTVDFNGINKEEINKEEIHHSPDGTAVVHYENTVHFKH